MVVVLHGLSGGSHEIYLRHVLEPLAEAGWEGCVVNSRGCAMSVVTTGVLYNARATWDVRQAVKWLRGRFPNRPLFGVGFSLGANILVNVRILDGSLQCDYDFWGRWFSDVCVWCCSILGKRERGVSLRLRLCVLIRGIWRWGIWRCRGRGWGRRFIRRLWGRV